VVVEDSRILKRVNVRISTELDKWFTEKSRKTGIAKSALMHLALEEHVRMQDITSSMQGLLALNEALNVVKEVAK
jgi:3-oxoacyl-[acyl-carrier-protein] synthase III